MAGSLGLTLDQVANRSKKLLDFESSIRAEMEAEVFLGRDINLNRARTAALSRDYGTVLEEITREQGDLVSFLELGQLAQDSFATALGTTSDELADQILMQTNINELMQSGRNIDAETLIQRKQQLSAQEAFNAALEKMKTIAINLVAMIETSAL